MPPEERTATQDFGERMHRTLCRNCRRARRQLIALSDALKSLGEGADGKAAPLPDAEMRERILSNVRRV